MNTSCILIPSGLIYIKSEILTEEDGRPKYSLHNYIYMYIHILLSFCHYISSVITMSQFITLTVNPLQLEMGSTCTCTLFSDYEIHITIETRQLSLTCIFSETSHVSVLDGTGAHAKQVHHPSVLEAG